MSVVENRVDSSAVAIETIPLIWWLIWPANLKVYICLLNLTAQSRIKYFWSNRFDRYGIIKNNLPSKQRPSRSNTRFADSARALASSLFWHQRLFMTMIQKEISKFRWEIWCKFQNILESSSKSGIWVSLPNPYGKQKLGVLEPWIHHLRQDLRLHNGQSSEGSDHVRSPIQGACIPKGIFNDTALLAGPFGNHSLHWKRMHCLLRLSADLKFAHSFLHLCRSPGRWQIVEVRIPTGRQDEVSIHFWETSSPYTSSWQESQFPSVSIFSAI